MVDEGILMNECGYVEEPIRRKNRKGNQCKKNNTITMRVAEEQWVNMQRDEAGKQEIWKAGKRYVLPCEANVPR